MKTDQQVRLLMSLINKGLTLESAAVRAAMSAPTARKYRDSAKLPSERRSKRRYRTRADPFEGVWPEVVELLEVDSGLEGKTIFEELCERNPGKFRQGQLRTLQRRVREWRALNGPEKEVFFPQEHRPGHQSQSDFTSMSNLRVTIAGEPFDHLLYHFVLTYSNWEYVEVAYSESFEALSGGLEAALFSLGRVPEEHRTDNLTAATHQLRGKRGRAFNDRYLELLGHYGMSASKSSPGRGNENGDVESSHAGIKNVIDQRLRLRGRRDFASLDGYREFLGDVIRRRNRRVEERLREELAVMAAPPARRFDSSKEEFRTVTRYSTVRVLGKIYSVPSRLRGERLRVLIFSDRIELEYKGELVQKMERLRGKESSLIDYRHVIHSLVVKPGAFDRYVYREQMFPRPIFRRAYDSLKEKSESKADLEYLRILHLAATTMECQVAEALSESLGKGKTPDYLELKSLLLEEDFSCPEVHVEEPELESYDELVGWRPEETQEAS